MKKLFKVALVAICILSIGSFANAQQKIGYINTEALLQLMPETKTIKAQIDALSKTLTDSMNGLTKEHDDKIAAYQKNQATMSDAQRQLAGGDISDLEKRMTTFRDNAQQQVDAKVAELIKPVNDKIHAAIAAVAKEKGYTYVISTAQVPDLLLVAPEGDDLMNAVKVKLGLGAGAPAAAPATPPSVIKK